MPKVWSAEQDKILIDNYQNLSCTKIQSQLMPDRSVGSIQARINKLGISKGRYVWSKKDIKLLKKYYSKIYVEELHEKYLPHISILKIISKASCLHIRRKLRALGFTHEYVVSVLSKYNLTALDKYQKCEHPMNIQCWCGKEYKGCFVNIYHNRGHIGCKQCRGKINSNEKIQKVLNKHNLTLVSDYYGWDKDLNIKCWCGKLYTTNYNAIIALSNVGCKSCRKQSRNKSNGYIRRESTGKAIDSFDSRYYQWKTSAIKRNHKWEVDKKCLQKLYNIQNGNCGLTGENIYFHHGGGLSIDRINNDIGYSEGNIWFIGPEVNVIKHKFSLTELYKWCNLCIIPYKTKEFSKSCIEYCWSSSFGGCGNLRKSYYNTLFRRLKEVSVEVSMEHLWGLFLEQKGRCSITGVELYFPKPGENAYNQTASLDRIDNNKGYIRGNVQWVHKIVNQMKNNFDYKYFISLCKQIISHKNKTTHLLEKIQSN